MVKKNNGNVKKYKKMKCDKCHELFEIKEEEIVKISGIKYISCPYCGQEHIL